MASPRLKQTKVFFYKTRIKFFCSFFILGYLLVYIIERLLLQDLDSPAFKEGYFIVIVTPLIYAWFVPLFLVVMPGRIRLGFKGVFSASSYHARKLSSPGDYQILFYEDKNVILKTSSSEIKGIRDLIVWADYCFSKDSTHEPHSKKKENSPASLQAYAGVYERKVDQTLTLIIGVVLITINLAIFGLTVKGVLFAASSALFALIPFAGIRTNLYPKKIVVNRNSIIIQPYRGKQKIINAADLAFRYTKIYGDTGIVHTTVFDREMNELFKLPVDFDNSQQLMLIIAAHTTEVPEHMTLSGEVG